MNFFYDYYKSICAGVFGLYFVISGTISMINGEYEFSIRGGGSRVIINYPDSIYYSLFFIGVGLFFIILLIRSIKEYIKVKQIISNKDFNIKQLKEVFNIKNINGNLISINGEMKDRTYCINMNNEFWEVFYNETGKKVGLEVFTLESEACKYLFELLNKTANNVK